MNATLETISRETMTSTNINRPIVSFEGKVIVCFTLRRQLSELSIDFDIDDNSENNKEATVCSAFQFNRCNSKSKKSGTSKSGFATPKSMNKQSRSALYNDDMKKLSTDLLNQFRPYRSITSSPSNGKSNICFSKIFQKTDTLKSDMSPKMPTRRETILELQDMTVLRM
jgi:hypothetical protein